MLATTIPSTEEASSPARGPEIAMASSGADPRGLIAPRAMTASFATASGTSVSHIHFELCLTTQAHPHTCVGSPVVSENLEPTKEHDVYTFHPSNVRAPKRFGLARASGQTWFTHRDITHSHTHLIHGIALLVIVPVTDSSLSSF